MLFDIGTTYGAPKTEELTSQQHQQQQQLLKKKYNPGSAQWFTLSRWAHA